MSKSSIVKRVFTIVFFLGIVVAYIFALTSVINEVRELDYAQKNNYVDNHEDCEIFDKDNMVHRVEDVFIHTSCGIFQPINTDVLDSLKIGNVYDLSTTGVNINHDRILWRHPIIHEFDIVK